MNLRAACLIALCFGAGFRGVQGQSPLLVGEHRAVENGVKLWYEVDGKSQLGQAPVLFLHGGPGYNSYSFEHTIGKQLESHMQMIYLDERGSQMLHSISQSGTPGPGLGPRRANFR